MEDELPSGGIEVQSGNVAALEARWADCWKPRDVARRLDGISAPWYVAAGWALDLFRGEQTREHHDIEIAVPVGRFPEIRERFAEFTCDAVGAARIWESDGDATGADCHSADVAARARDGTLPA
ncbi:nucleotidyltransferase domain-containing protein [Micromonospora sp. NPDC047740]|uniref:nucleotidyltransferase domain-containing protein n=1 Tax=Micromonospora sp. NPDC047740 TaxID=3364254 RepID=UPI003724AE12